MEGGDGFVILEGLDVTGWILFIGASVGLDSVGVVVLKCTPN